MRTPAHFSQQDVRSPPERTSRIRGPIGRHARRVVKGNRKNCSFRASGNCTLSGSPTAGSPGPLVSFGVFQGAAVPEAATVLSWTSTHHAFAPGGKPPSSRVAPAARRTFWLRTHAVAVAADVDDVAVVQQSINQRHGHHLVAQHLAPFLEALVRGQHRRGLLMAGADQLEEQHRTLSTHRKVADFVEPPEAPDGSAPAGGAPVGPVACVWARMPSTASRAPGISDRQAWPATAHALFTRTMYGARVSLSIGLVGVFFSFILGTMLGGISGCFEGSVDNLIQRTIELLISIPTIPLWMTLAAALRRDWPVVKNYFVITIILSVIGWGGLARVVRGTLLSLRSEDFVGAARISGAGEGTIIARHLLPSFASYIIVSITLAIPYMILGETALLSGPRDAAPGGELGSAADRGPERCRHCPTAMVAPAMCVFVVITVLMFKLHG